MKNRLPLLLAAALFCAASRSHASSPNPKTDTLIRQEVSVHAGYYNPTYRTGNYIGLRVATLLGFRRHYPQFRTRFTKAENGWLYVCRENRENNAALAAGQEPARMRAIPISRIKAVVDRDIDWEARFLTGNAGLDFVLCLALPPIIPIALGILIGKLIGHLLSPNRRYSIKDKKGRARRSKVEAE